MKRLCSDWDNLAAGMRKCWTYKDAVLLHTACGMFLHMDNLLRAKAPASEYNAASGKLLEQFMCGIMDAELIHVAENGVPPGNIQDVSYFRSSCCFNVRPCGLNRLKWQLLTHLNLVVVLWMQTYCVQSVSGLW